MKNKTTNGIWLVFGIAFILSFSAGLVYATVFTDTYDTNTPQGSDNPAEADDRMREIKAGVQERENVDHYWPLTGTEVSDADTGEHRKITFHEPIATPTNVADKGFVYTKDSAGSKAELTWLDEDGNEIQLTDLGEIPFSSLSSIGYNTFFTAIDLAGTGTVALIRSGRNEANTLDVSNLPNATRLTSSAAPTEDSQVVNKKYVDDAIPLVIAGASGGTSETYIGRLQLKWGAESVLANSTEPVTFTSKGLAAFDNSLFTVQATYNATKTSLEHSCAVSSLAPTGFDLTNGDSEARTIYWFAVGR